MNDQAPGPRNTSNHDRLNGWKEISAHFGKSVRSVQRWERELGLPVHRIHTAGGDVVFAFRSELEKWESGVDEYRKRESEENGRPEENGETEVGAGIPNAKNAGGDSKAIAGRFGRMRLIGAAALVLAVVVWGAWHLQLVGAADRQPAFARFESDTLKVFNERGDKLWEHRFPFALSADNYNKPVNLSEMISIAIEDLDRDGEKELLMLTWGDPGVARRLICFNWNGSKRFDVQPNRSMQYGETRETPPYLVTGFQLTTEPDGTKTIWAVAVHNYEFPSVLWKLDRHGKVTGEYWSNGHIKIVQESRLDGRRVMLVGAMDNESVAASLAVLDYENSNGFAPAENPKYRCANCPVGEPLAFYVFPRTEMSREFNTRPVVSQIRITPDHQATITTVQLNHQIPGEPGIFGADIWYTFDDKLHLAEAATGDTYRRLHSVSDVFVRLNHKFGPKCEAEILPVLTWNGKKFVELPPPKQVKSSSVLSATFVRR